MGIRQPGVQKKNRELHTKPQKKTQKKPELRSRIQGHSDPLRQLEREFSRALKMQEAKSKN